ncbi:MAG: potassium-transporting ATPase subunit KdpA, partial [Clostridiales bacterium]
IAVLFALIRGFRKVQETGLGSFWVDMTRVILYLMIPLCLVLSLFFVSQGVPQSLKPYDAVTLLEPVTAADGTIVTRQVVPLGAVASQVAPKQTGTNGGGVYGVNSAHPMENPTP